MFCWDVVIVGGGAAGFFTAINIKENNPEKTLLILEKSSTVLGKVKVSGGGRCNVTNACFTPKELVRNYPRGEKELLGPFHTFMTGDMMAWLSDHGVETKIEDDNRVFPESNISQTIVDCFLDNAKKLGVKINLKEGMRSFCQNESVIEIETSETIHKANQIVIATGSSKQVWQNFKSLDVKTIDPVPSLFTFNIKDLRLKDLMGLSVPYAEVKIDAFKRKEFGPLLITHWGLSGPAILKLSAWGALDLASVDYKFSISINWISETIDEVFDQLKSLKSELGNKNIVSNAQFNLPKRLWESFVKYCDLDSTSWANASNEKLKKLANELTEGKYSVNGKSTFKDEFVTAGGVDLKEIDFKSMSLKKHPNIFVVGEALNIDAITGGFNFQAAWTTSYLAAQYISK